MKRRISGLLYFIGARLAMMWKYKIVTELLSPQLRKLNDAHRAMASMLPPSRNELIVRLNDGKLVDIYVD